MLVSIVIVALYIIILKWIENPIIDNIRKSKEISEIIYNRQKLKKIRKGSLLIPLVMCVLLHVFYKIYFSLAWWDMELIKSLFWAIFGCYIALRVRKDHNPLGTLSVLSKDDVVNSGKDYVLFLRGFDKDDYTPKAKIKKYQRHYSYFSEYHFTKIFKRYIDIYAVGMTQEIEAPTGAKRVYLSDIEWKKDVYDLMQSSKLIVVLVNDRSSCIWEIEKSATMLDKTIYIVDEEDKYERVRLQLQSIVKLPQLSNKVSLPIAIKLSSQSRTKIFSIEHSYKSYKKIIKILLERYMAMKTTPIFYRTFWGRLIIAVALLVSSVIFSSVFSVFIGNGYNNVYFFFGAIAFCIIGSYYIYTKIIGDD